MTMLPCPICGSQKGLHESDIGWRTTPLDYGIADMKREHQCMCYWMEAGFACDTEQEASELWNGTVVYVEELLKTNAYTRTPSNEGMEKAVECKKCAADRALDEALDKVFEKVSAMSKAEFAAMVGKHKDGDMAQLLNHSGMFDCYDVHEERDKMEKALRDVLAIGYNKDCMFCGFKDKIALQATGHSEAD